MKWNNYPIVLMVLFFSLSMYGQTNLFLKSPRGLLNANDLAPIPAYMVKAPDQNQIEKLIANSEKNGQMYTIAQLMPHQLNPSNAGVWTEFPDGSRMWRLHVQSPQAKGLAFYFSDFDIPNGSVLFSYNPDNRFVEGPHYANENTQTTAYATAIVPGSTAVLEYFQPAGVEGEPRIEIENIGYFFRGVEFLENKEKNAGQFGDSEFCQVNVNCAEGNSWQNQKRSVVKIIVVEGNMAGFCSGALVNNTAEDCKNYLLTAQHCGAGASAANMGQWTFYFNFEGPGCNDPASATNLDDQTKVGCVKKAASGTTSDVNHSDFLLLELNGTIPAAYNVYYAGWDRSTSGSSSGVSIHHPSGDIKKISTYSSSLVSSTWWGGTANAHWQVIWSATANGHGVTEGGSSGSPIFNNSGRIVGDLSGGSSYCTATNAPDLYGKFSHSWQSAGSAASQQLKPWLDPLSTNPQFLNGKNACGSTPPPPGNACDTSGNFIINTHTASNISVGSWGYLGGNNSYGDLAKADKFTNTYPTGSTLTGALYFFASKSGTGSFPLKIWAANGTGGTPGTEIVSANLSLASTPINGTPIIMTLNTPYTLTGDFFVGAVLPTGGNTVSLITSADNQVNAPYGWEQYSDGTWHSYFDGYNKHYTHAILPIVCPPSGNVGMEPTSYADNVEALKLFPNPASDIAYIISANSQKISEVKLIDMTGKTVWTKVYPQADFQATVETSSLRNGVYQLMVRVNGNWIAKKLVISK